LAREGVKGNEGERRVKLSIVLLLGSAYEQEVKKRTYLPPLNDICIFCDISWYVLQIAMQLRGPPLIVMSDVPASILVIVGF